MLQEDEPPENVPLDKVATIQQNVLRKNAPHALQRKASQKVKGGDHVSKLLKMRNELQRGRPVIGAPGVTSLYAKV